MRPFGDAKRTVSDAGKAERVSMHPNPVNSSLLMSVILLLQAKIGTLFDKKYPPQSLCLSPVAGFAFVV